MLRYSNVNKILVLFSREDTEKKGGQNLFKPYKYPKI